jgi:hypothetical protein
VARGGVAEEEHHQVTTPKGSASASPYLMEMTFSLAASGRTTPQAPLPVYYTIIHIHTGLMIDQDAHKMHACMSHAWRRILYRN